MVLPNSAQRAVNAVRSQGFEFREALLMNLNLTS